MSEEKTENSNKTPVLLMFLGAIFTAIGALAVIPVAGFAFFGILSLVGFILLFIGVCLLKNRYPNFQSAFVSLLTCIIIALGCLILSAIAGGCGNVTVAQVMSIIVLAATIVELVFNIKAIASIIKGCSDVTPSTDVSSFGEITYKWFKISVIVAISVIALSIVLCIVAMAAPNTANVLGTIDLVASIISACFTIAADVLVTVLLGKTNASIK